MASNNADTFVVKLTFDGQLRRFPVAKGTTFLALHGQVVSMLGRAPEADIVLKYTDEEGDLITITSDLELNSALVPGQLLRLTAIEKKANVGYPPLDAPMTDASFLAPALGSVPDASAPPQGADVFRGFAYGCGRGMAGMDGSPQQHAPFGPHRGAFGPRGGFGWRGRGGHRGGFGPHGPHPHGPHHGPHHHGPHPYDHPFFRRGDMTSEEWQKAKKEHHKDHKDHKHAHKEAHKHMKKEWKAAHKYMKKEMKEKGFPPGFETMGGMPWSFAPGCGDHKDRLVARYAKDLTIPDGSQIAPNSAFVKTWRLRNEGAEWPAGCVLRFLGKKSDGLGAPEAVVIPGPVASDTEVDVSVNLIAPEKPGRYTGYWKMCTPEGKKFGQRVWVSIVVPSSNNNNSSSSDDDKEADRYESMVDTVLAMGFNVKRHRVFRMLQKTEGDISLVCERLSHKQEKQARKEMKKGMKLC